MANMRTVQVDLDALRNAHDIAEKMILTVGVVAVGRMLNGTNTPENIVNDSYELGEAVGKRDTLAALIQGFEAQGVRYN